MPGLTIQTDSVSSRDPTSSAQDVTSVSNPSRSSQSPPPSRSPTRPPISPITPTLSAAELPSSSTLPPPQRFPAPPSSEAMASRPDFAAGRQTYTYSQLVPDASSTAIPPPRPEPIDFESNPDVLAIKSAISILQMQRHRAVNDIRSLGAAKEAAVADPQSFIRDLASGQVRNQGNPAAGSVENYDSPTSSSEADEDGKKSQKHKTKARTLSGGKKERGQSGRDATGTEKGPSGRRPGKSEAEPPWKTLPRPQNVVRCPPINWSQYAVVGESLDKLHTEQIARPTQGQPATLGAGGTYEFGPAGEGQDREYVGVAAPYTPGQDRIEKRTRGGQR